MLTRKLGATGYHWLPGGLLNPLESSTPSTIVFHAARICSNPIWKSTARQAPGRELTRYRYCVVTDAMMAPPVPTITLWLLDNSAKRSTQPERDLSINTSSTPYVPNSRCTVAALLRPSGITMTPYCVLRTPPKAQ